MKLIITTTCLLLVCCYYATVTVSAGSVRVSLPHHHHSVRPTHHNHHLQHHSRHDHHDAVAATDGLRSAASHSNKTPRTIVRPSNVNSPTSSTFLEYYATGSPSICQFNGGQLVLNATSGECSVTDGINGSVAYYCDETGGYIVFYTSNNCNSNSISGITKFDLGCSGGGSIMYECQNPELAPPLPFVWPPPSNWIVRTDCDDLYPAHSCSAEPSENILCRHSAIPANQCIPSGDGQSAYINFCTEDSEWSGHALYSSADCSDEVATMIHLGATACNSTFSTTQCVGSPVSLSAYPSAGYFMRGTANECLVTPVSSINYQQPNECFNSEIYNCTVPGQLVITDYEYGTNCASNSSTSTSGPLTTNECTETGHIFFCDGQPFSQPPRSHALPSHNHH